MRGSSTRNIHNFVKFLAVLALLLIAGLAVYFSAQTDVRKAHAESACDPDSIQMCTYLPPQTGEVAVRALQVSVGAVVDAGRTIPNYLTINLYDRQTGIRYTENVPMDTTAFFSQHTTITQNDLRIAVYVMDRIDDDWFGKSPSTESDYDLEKFIDWDCGFPGQ